MPEALDYYMGDKDYTEEDTAPYIIYIDEERERIDVVDIEIKEWNPSQPLKGNIK